MMRGQSGPLSGGDHYWKAIRELVEANGGTFTISQLWKRSGGVRRTGPYNYVKALLHDRHVELVDIVDDGRGHRQQVFSLLTTGAKPPVLTELHNPRLVCRQQLWTAMRALRTFTIRELAYAASTDDRAVSEDTAQGYLWWLRRAGYVQLVRRAGNVGHYRLVPSKNSGPLAPISQRRQKNVIDRNNGETVNLNGTRLPGWSL